jgi:hypothetical protein
MAPPRAAAAAAANKISAVVVASALSSDDDDDDVRAAPGRKRKLAAVSDDEGGGGGGGEQAGAGSDSETDEPPPRATSGVHAAAKRGPGRPPKGTGKASAKVRPSREPLFHPLRSGRVAVPHFEASPSRAKKTAASAPGPPRVSAEQGRALLERRLRVHWQAEEAWYPARVARFDGRKKAAPFLLRYDDGDEEWGMLTDTAFVWLDAETGRNEESRVEFLTVGAPGAQAPAPAEQPAKPAAAAAAAAPADVPAAVPAEEPERKKGDLEASAARFKHHHAALEAKKKAKAVVLLPGPAEAPRRRPPPAAGAAAGGAAAAGASPAAAPHAAGAGIGASSDAPGVVTERVVECGQFLGAVIGQGGRIIREIEASSGAKLVVSQVTKSVTCTGTKAQVEKAAAAAGDALDHARRKEAARAKLAAEAAAPKAAPPAATAAAVPGAVPSAAALPGCLAALVSKRAAEATPAVVPHADAFRGVAPAAPLPRSPPRQPSPPSSPPPPALDEAASGALEAFRSLLDKVTGSQESISAASRHALAVATVPGAAAACARELLARMEAPACGRATRLHLFWVVDSVAQNAHGLVQRHPGTERAEAAKVYARFAVSRLARLVAAVAPRGREGRENRPRVTKVLAIWRDRGVVGPELLLPHAEALAAEMRADPDALRVSTGGGGGEKARGADERTPATALRRVDDDDELYLRDEYGTAASGDLALAAPGPPPDVATLEVPLPPPPMPPPMPMPQHYAQHLPQYAGPPHGYAPVPPPGPPPMAYGAHAGAYGYVASMPPQQQFAARPPLPAQLPPPPRDERGYERGSGGDWRAREGRDAAPPRDRSRERDRDRDRDRERHRERSRERDRDRDRDRDREREREKERERLKERDKGRDRDRERDRDRDRERERGRSPRRASAAVAGWSDADAFLATQVPPPPPRARRDEATPPPPWAAHQGPLPPPPLRYTAPPSQHELDRGRWGDDRR